MNGPPVTDDFFADADEESRYQAERWGAAHDADKTDEEWFWLLGWLLAKATLMPEGDELTKQRHRLRAAAAALKHWDDQLTRRALGQWTVCDEEVP